MSEPRVILIVCTANVCRSPMAAGLLRQRLAAAGLEEGYQVRSAGTWAAPGSPASTSACRVMAGRGIDITQHRAWEIGPHDVIAADLILVMTAAHREAIVAEFSEARGKTYLLSEMIGKSYDVADPFGSSLANYEYCAEDLSHLIEAGFDRILSLTDGNAGR